MVRALPGSARQLQLRGKRMTTGESQDEAALQYALEELQELAQRTGMTGSDITALLEVMNIYEVLEYLDAKMSNRLQ